MTQQPTQQQGFLPFVVLMAMIFSISPFAIDMYLPALPTMADFFSSSIDAMEASVAVYLIFFALGQLIFGALADSVNKSKLLSFGLIVFTLASVMIGLAASLTELYCWRAVQAFSGGCSVIVFALIHSIYGNNQSSQIISYIFACVVIAPMIAPMIGSQILMFAGWEWIFFVLAGFSIIILATQIKLLPPSKVSHTPQPLNLRGLLSAYKSVLSNSTTMAYVLAGGSAFAGLFAFIAGSPYVYIEYFGVTPTQFSFLVALNAIAMVTMNLINARVLTDIDPTKKLIVAGFLLALMGTYLVIVAFLHLPIAYVVVGVVAYIGLLGLTSANAISSALANAGKNAGVLSGINGVLQFGLGALSSAVISISASTDAITMTATMALCAFSTLSFVCFLNYKTKLTRLEECS